MARTMRMAHPTARRSSHRGELVWGGISLGSLVLLTAALRPYREDLDPGTVALVLLIVPLIAALASLRVAIAMAVVSALAFNFSFTEPYDSLRIESTTSLVAFVIYVVLAISFGLLVTRLRRTAATSDDRAAQALLLRDLTIDLVRQNVWLQPPLSSALTDIVGALHLAGASLSVDVPGGERFTSDAGDATASRAALSSIPTTDVDRPRGDLQVTTLRGTGSVRMVPIATATDTFGMLAVEPEDGSELGESDERIVNMFANVVALACERAVYMSQAVERKALEETDRLRTALMQAVSHDLRTPLASINALASALPALGELGADQQEILDDIVRQTDRLARLVDQVLDVSRIESGSLRLQLQTVSLDDVVLAAVDAVKGSFDELIEVALPEETQPIPVDETLLKQALVNLLENAARYGAPPVTVSLVERPTMLEIRVVDHGQGIPEAERRRIFDPSYAMRRKTTDERSRGLGLAISAGFVAAHHGTTRVEPTAGGGATFVVSLPRGRAATGGGET